MSTTHHILLLGGTGLCGQLFTRAALEAGHQLTLYARSPTKLASDLSSHANLRIIQGELDDAEGLSEAASCGADTFVSLAGPTIGRREGIPVTTALRTLYPLLLARNPKIRILLLSTASYDAPQDTRSIKWFFAIHGYVRIIGGDSYTEIRGMAEETVKLGDTVDWTVFRVPLLSGKDLSAPRQSSNQDGKEGFDITGPSENDKNAGVHSGFVGNKMGWDGLFLERGRLVIWILGELEEKRWIRLCPILANA